MSRGSQHSAAKRRKEKERQAKQAAKRERRLHKGEGGEGTAAENNDTLVREYLGLPVEPEEGQEANTEEEAGEEPAAGEPAP